MIYYLEDDRNIRELVLYTLSSSGYAAVGFAASGELYAALEKAVPELLLLDIMLPGEDGITVLQKLRQRRDTRRLPVMMITAKGAEYDKVIGLDSGADDYMSKPFGMMELVSRVKALLRRASENAPVKTAYSSCGISMDEERHMVTADGRAISLTLKEYELLRMLMANEGAVMTRDMLLSGIWGYDFDGETRTVDVHVRTLRQKLGECGVYIETVRGVGYRFGEGI